MMQESHRPACQAEVAAALGRIGGKREGTVSFKASVCQAQDLYLASEILLCWSASCHCDKIAEIINLIKESGNSDSASEASGLLAGGGGMVSTTGL